MSHQDNKPIPQMPMKLGTVATFEARAALNGCAAEFKGGEIATGKASEPLGAVAIFRDTSNYAAAVAGIALSKMNPKA
jgi:hypothetical protein